MLPSSNTIYNLLPAVNKELGKDTIKVNKNPKPTYIRASNIRLVVTSTALQVLSQQQSQQSEPHKSISPSLGTYIRIYIHSNNVLYRETCV